ncbi:MAG: response regulator, partial [Prochloraceae cyanobacterium]|nr:response regulator [Prochloraceae cyanobacterium]
MNNFSKNELIDKFHQCKSSLQDCILKIDTFEKYDWCIYFRLGRIVWISGGQHRFRRWQRLIDRIHPNLNYDRWEITEQIDPNLSEYFLIKTLLKNKLFQRDRAIATIDRTIIETLFDILQSESRISKVELKQYEYADNSPLKEALLYVNPDVLLSKVQTLIDNWVKSGIASFSPNLALVLLKPQQLQSLTDPKTYEKISFLVDGEKTLRDLEIITKQDILTLGISFLPYIQKNIIGFRKIVDLPNPISQIRAQSDRQNIVQRDRHNRTEPLILCVDDSPKVCQAMDKILNREGYKLIAVSDSLEVLPVLIENKPDLIFLDLVMPVANGYEICAQIRKISMFKNTPVVILTG